MQKQPLNIPLSLSNLQASRSDNEVKSFLSPHSSDHWLDRRQQVLHWDLTVTALLIEAVLPGHVGVCCFGGGENIQRKKGFIHFLQIITVLFVNTSFNYLLLLKRFTHSSDTHDDIAQRDFDFEYWTILKDFECCKKRIFEEFWFGTKLFVLLRCHMHRQWKDAFTAQIRQKERSFISSHVRDVNDNSKLGEPANQFALASKLIDSSASWLTLTPHMTAATQHARPRSVH